MRSDIGLVGVGERNTLRVWKPLPTRHVLKNLEGKFHRDSPKSTISATGGLGSLQIVSERDTGQCANEVVCQQGCWGPKGWTRRSHIWASKGGGLGDPASVGE